MRVLVTGATGFIGSHVLTELREHGHDVTALVRNDDQARVVAARGASEAVVDLHDRATVVGRLRSADAAIHTASPGDATSADAAGAPGAVPGSDDEARARLGDSFAEVLLLDQGTDAAKARAERDWRPSRPGLVEELHHGSYGKAAAR